MTSRSWTPPDPQRLSRTPCYRAVLWSMIGPLRYLSDREGVAEPVHRLGAVVDGRPRAGDSLGVGRRGRRHEQGGVVAIRCHSFSSLCRAANGPTRTCPRGTQKAPDRGSDTHQALTTSTESKLQQLEPSTAGRRPARDVGQDVRLSHPGIDDIPDATSGAVRTPRTRTSAAWVCPDPTCVEQKKIWFPC